jgi:hypothetical protein
MVALREEQVRKDAGRPSQENDTNMRFCAYTAITLWHSFVFFALFVANCTNLRRST